MCKSMEDMRNKAAKEAAIKASILTYREFDIDDDAIIKRIMDRFVLTLEKADVDSMAEYWTIYPSLKEILFQPLRPGYLHPAVSKDEVVSVITSHPEFICHADQVDDAYSHWKEGITPDLMGLSREISPKELIVKISEALLADFARYRCWTSMMSMRF